jgi:hypothetical protein
MVSKKDCLAADFYNAYIELAPEQTPAKSIKKSTAQFKKFLKSIPEKKINYAYAKDKWTIKELLQHLIDAERVFSYRALTFARKDVAHLPSFDENSWAANAAVKKRKWKDLVEEFMLVRQANELLFASFDDEHLLCEGTASNKKINVAAIGFICAGHVMHHIRIIRERYLS